MCFKHLFIFPSLSGILFRHLGVVLMQDHQAGKVRGISFSGRGKHSTEPEAVGGKAQGGTSPSLCSKESSVMNLTYKCDVSRFLCNPVCTQPKGRVRHKGRKSKDKKKETTLLKRKKKRKMLFRRMRCFVGFA